MADETNSENTAVDPIEGAPEATEEVNVGELYEMDLDKMRTKIELGLDAEEAEARRAEAEAVEEAPSEEPAEEAASEPEAETTDEPSAVTEPTDETEVTEAEELRAMLEEQQAQTKHFESLLGAKTGEDGYFKRKAAELEQRLAQMEQGGTASDEFAETTQPRQSPQAKPASDSSASYLVGLAIKDASQAFLNSTPDLYLTDAEGKAKIDPDTGQPALDPEFKNAIATVSNQINGLLQMDDPVAAGQEASRLLSSAWAKADLTKKRAHRMEIQRRRADQAERLKSKKRASASASTGAAPPRPKKREVDPMTMPMDELRKLADKEAKDAGLL